jgi:hypothetical protein
MGRFYERYKKHPEKGTDYYFNQISSYAASLMLGRDFGESAESFIARSPGYRECLEDRKLLSEVVKS